MLPVFSCLHCSLCSILIDTCLFKFQLITVYRLPNMEPDWLIAERGSQKGKVPTTYLEVLE